MVANDRDDFDPRYSRYPMTFSDVVAALFRSLPKRMRTASGPSAIDASGLQLLGAKSPAADVPPSDSKHAA